MLLSDVNVSDEARDSILYGGGVVELEGGCPWCDAYQRLRYEGRGAWHMTVHHDDDCADLSLRRRRHAERLEGQQ